MSRIDLSILILTHNRPKLFERCLNSVLKQNLKDIEILVNNDSDDILESSKYTLYRVKSQNLSEIYFNLFKNAKGKYIYFLEDDDYLLEGFKDFYKEVLKDDYDFSIAKYLKHNLKPMKFNKEDFQLSQVIFKREKIKYFPFDNNIENDYKLYINNKNDNTLVSNKVIFKQTTDGKDNISFKCFNKDKRFENNS